MELPTGTVSMLFSDIEGSTLLLNRLGPAYSDALDSHRRIMRRGWSAHDGTEVGTEGDSFFVAFRSASDAVTAAAEVQRELDSYSWPAGEQVKVRIGLHTGSPQVHDGGYVGMDVHRAARIAAAAHGGQVIMSSVTAELARDALPHGVALRDLGPHQLKDIATPEHLWQLDVDGLPTGFRALRTIGAESRLPTTATRLVGRDQEVVALTDLLRQPDVRLVTLTGPGGSGKTRLAVELARALTVDFPDGIYFVPLATISGPDLMWASIAEVVDAPPMQRTVKGVTEYLSNRRALVVLDNLEQLADADGVVAELLSTLPRLAVVATSRRALGVPGEYRHPVRPLALPAESTPQAVSSSSAVQLFVEFGRRLGEGFTLTDANAADVAAICRRLDGLPLAMELAATRLRLLGPRALLRRIDSALDIASASRRPESRQRTLRDTIAWSYHLLTLPQQQMFRRLGVFAGGADLDSIAAVALGSGTIDPLDVVADLVDVSLVAAVEQPDGEPRFAMLETIRAYAREQLRLSGEESAVRDRHAHHYLGVADQLSVEHESQHLKALDRAESEHDNFREALAWTLEDGPGSSTGSSAEIGLRLCAALGWLWYTGGYAGEGLRWYERAVGQTGDQTSKELASCLAGMANLLLAKGRPDPARELAGRAVAMARSLGETETVAFGLSVLGTAEQHSGQPEDARRHLDEAVVLYREHLGPSTRMGHALGNLAGIEEGRGNYTTAEQLLTESLATHEGLGDSHEATIQRQNLANLLVTTGRPEEANEMATSLVDSVLAFRNPNLTMAFSNTFMNIHLHLGRPVPAAHLFGAEQAMRERLDMPNPYEDEELEEARKAAQEQMSLAEWDRERQHGQHQTLEDLLSALRPSS